MSTIEHLLTELGSREIVLRRDGDKLLVNAPIGAMTPELASQIREQKTEIIAFLASAQGPSHIISKAPEGQAPTLSFAQQRMWFLDQLEGGKDPNGIGSAHYNIPIPLRLSGQLNIPALERAFSEIVARHEALRSRFPTFQGECVLEITEPTLLSIPLHDLSDEVHPEEKAKQGVLEDASSGFNLATGPLFRSQLFLLSPGEYVLLVIMHHIISDGWSSGQLVRELAQLYPYYCQDVFNTRPLLPPLEIQYRDFAYWQRQKLSGEEREKQLRYWEKALADIPSLHQIPTDRPRPRVMSYRGASQHFSLDSELSNGLRALAKKTGASLFMVLEAGFATLLHRYSGQHHMVIGTPIANRNHHQLEPLIGLFVNTLVIRNDLHGDPSFLTFLHRVKATALEAYDHQDMPFEQILERLDPERNLSYSPIFQVMFSLANTPQTRLELPDLRLVPFDLGLKTAKFDLNMTMGDSGDHLGGGLEYSTDLFDASTIARMLGHFKELLAAIVAQPDSRLSRLAFLTPIERNQLLITWNATDHPFAHDRCIHQLFEEQAARTPHALAVRDASGNVTLTYAELNAWSDRIADVLRSMGVKPWVRVGLMVERSPEMIAGVYGILKAGGAYVPIDPTYPAERIAFILMDSQAPVLLTTSAWTANLRSQDTQVVCLDQPLPEVGPSSAPMPTATPDDLIYIIYTSGSTGIPKGAGVFHRSFVNMVQWFIDDFELSDQDRVLLTSSVSFDLTQKNLYAPLLIGGSLHLGPSGLYDPKAIADLVSDRQITWMNCTPSAFYPVYEDSGPEWEARLASLRWVFLGGEPISIARLKPWLEQPACKAVVVNTYGPTECTDISNSFPMPEPMSYLNRATPIGPAVYNVKLVILDQHQELLPLGAMGELCIYGVSTGPGYLNDPALTAQKFLPNSHSGVAGDRLYRTGDLVRYLPDGAIEFIGRIDHQIKIRGFRIELGEIEAALVKMPEVREAVALVKTEETSQDKAIVAFVLLEEGASQPDFASVLLQHLPDYMVPHFFEVMEAFPLTPSGKIDRNVLAKLKIDMSQGEQAYQPPQGDAEEAIAAVFAEILNLDSVSATASFFRMGGHSLLATRVMSRLREVFQRDIPLQSLFEAPSVRGLALQIQKAGEVTGAGIVPVPRDQPLPLSYSQERLWFLYQLEGPVATYNMPHAFRVSGPLALGLLEKAYSEVVARHENLRTRFIAKDDRSLLLIDPAKPLLIPILDLSHMEPEACEHTVRELSDAHGLHIFHLETGPLHRLTCLRLGPQEHVLLLNLHHIVSDGWSESLLMREMITLYHCFRLNQPSPLPALPIQYADYAAWQRDLFNSDAMEQQLAYWRAKLGDGPKPLSLPTDFSRPAVRTFSGGHCRQVLEAASAKLFQKGVGEKDATLFMGLLAAFYHLLARHSGMADLTVGTPIAGRNRGETEPLIGMFLNTLVLRADFSDPQLSFSQAMDQVRTLTLEAYANQDVPFEKLLEVLKPERDLSRTPLFQVFFNMLNLPEVDDSAVGDLRFEPIGNPEIGSKFDLTLYIAEQPDKSIGFNLHYNADLFEAQHMLLFLEQFVLLLRAVAQQPHVPLNQISLISEGTRAMLPDPLAALSTHWEGPVYAHMAHWAQTQPKKVAIQGEFIAISYAELEERTNALAHWLIRNNVDKGDGVVIYAARCPSLPVAMIATLKAGATLTILDPAYPVERLVYYTDAVQPKALLALESAGALPLELHVPAVLQLDERGQALALATMPVTPPTVEVLADDPACITFTSGSTGQPKGIVGRHGSLTHFMPWLSETFAFSDQDRFSLLSGLAHDPLQRDVFTPVWLGATICVPHANSIGPDLLFAWMERAGVTVSHLTPAMARIIAEREGDRRLAAFRLAFVTGDVLTTRDIQRLRGMTLRMDVVNFYGTTETQRAVAFARSCHDEPLWQREAMPLGRGIRDVQLLVVNQAGGLCGIGEIGEIYLRSPHVALGYLNLPELTAEKFIANPFNPDEKHSVYRTGDLGYYLPDGRVAFAGRADFQVKIRGYRIELSELEGVLAAHDQVDEAVAIIHEPKDADPFIVAYLQTEHWQDPALSASVRDHVRERLPGFMVPAVIQPMERLPLNPNGKVDRGDLRKLPLPQGDELVQGQTPVTETEQQLAAIWLDVLPGTRMERHANFFDLGGHSLNATQVITRIRDRLGVILPLRAIFEAPTIFSMAQLIDSERKNQHHEPALVPQARQGNLPLSFAQERLWFLDRHEGAHAAYNMPFAMRLEGPLNLDALTQALTEICARHEILRARFKDAEGQAVLEFRDAAPFLLPIESVSEGKVQERAALEAAKPFNLTQDPLFRAVLLKMGETSHALLITLHHIICDGWSLGVLSEEIATLYQQLGQGQVPALTPLPVQYADFAIWQRNWLKGQVLEEQLSYWRTRLQGSPSLLELPTDRPRPIQQTFHGARMGFQVPAQVTQELNRLAQAENATLFMVLEAAFALMLGRYSGSEDILIGSPVANRTRSETEKLIGLFVNTLVLRNDLSGNPSFRQFLARVRQTALDAYAHQDVPFEKVIDAANPERSLSFSPLFQVMLVFQNLPVGKRVAHDLTISRLVADNVTAKFDLTLTMNEAPGGLIGTFEYNSDLFDATTIETKIQHFQALLLTLTQNASKALSEIRFFDAAENSLRTPVTALPDFSEAVFQMIDRQANLTPGGTALIAADGTAWTYSQLIKKANGLAYQLLEMGIGPNAIVGVLTPRHPQMVVAMLAIHKCGAAYLPLDPTYPEARLQYMQDDAHLSALLTYDSQPITDVAHLDLKDFHRMEPAGPPVTIHPDQLSHLIYTSGSTGNPKGVAIPHRATAALIYWAQKTYGDIQWRGTLAATSMCFDLSVYELFAPLTCGGTVILAENALALASHPARDRVRLINTVPSAISELLLNQAIPEAVHTINLAGEPLRGELVRKLYELPYLQRVYNLYGPSEDTTYSTGAMICRSSKTEPSIGLPLPGTEALILGLHLEELPKRAVGMLYLAGEGLAQGYIGQPAKTAEVFVPHPFGAGTRMYRTGDRARRLANGELAFLGRVDHQVKLRGFRIELGEIESELQKYGHVSAAAVLVLGNQLVAFVQTDQRESDAQLKSGLAQRLPAHMVPSRWVLVPQLPLTSNGKIDRKQLPSLAESQQLAEKVEIQPPQTELEMQLHEVWSEVLPKSQFGIDHNFFEIGGDSILSLRIIARARRHGLNLSTKAIFANPTIRQLAKLPNLHTLVAIDAEQGQVLGEVPLTPIQHWFLEKKWQRPDHFNQALLFSLPETVDVQRLIQALEKVVPYHDAFSLRFQKRGTGWQQSHIPGNLLEVQVHDVSKADDSATALTQHCEELQAKGDLANGPLVRAALFLGCEDLGSGQTLRLLIAVHHLVIDGISWRILLEDVGQVYQQPDITLPAKTTSFKAWSQKLQAYSVPRQEVAWWQYAVMQEAPRLPLDIPNSEATNIHLHTANVHASLDKETTQALLGDVHRAYRTQIDDLLLTALMDALWSQFNLPAVWVDMEGHGREALFEDVDLSRTIGWFTALFPIRLEAQGDRVATLKHLKDLRRAIPNKGLGYGLLRHLHQQLPPVQADIVFNYLGQTGESGGGAALFGAAPEASGARRSPQDQRTHLLEINAIVTGGQLQVTWSFAETCLKKETIQHLASGFTEALRSLIHHCLSPEAGGVTPSDFPLATLSQKALDHLVGQAPALVDLYPLAPMQEGMLFHHLAQPESGNYFEQLVLELEGDLDLPAFQKTWQATLDRHAILRTSFHWEGLGRPLQAVHDGVAIPLRQLDLRGNHPDQLAAQIQSAKLEERQTGFALDQAPLMRLLVLRLSESQWQVVWNYHHMLLDGWSSALVFREVMAGYARASEGQALTWPSVQPYGKYIQWLEQQDAEAADRFWSESLGGFTKATALPFEQPSKPGKLRHLEGVELRLSTEHQQTLSQFASQEGLTLNTLVQAAWALALGAYSASSDVLFGAIVAGRPEFLEGVETMVGLFINALPVRVRWSVEPLAAWLHQLQEQQLARESFSYTPLVQAQAHSQVPRGESLFESLVVFENYASPGQAETQTGDLGLQVLSAKQVEQTHFPLVLIAVPGETLRLKIGFDTARFLRADMEHLLQSLVMLLETMTQFSEATPRDLVHQLQPPVEEETTNLTENQMLIWMGQTLDPEDLTYNNLLTFRIHGPVEYGPFFQAVEDMVAASDTLRTVFHDQRGTPQSKVLPTMPAGKLFRDFSQEPDPENAYLTWLQTEKTHHFDLRACGWKSELCKLGDHLYLWHFNIHQILGDGEALSEIYQTVAARYQQLLNQDTLAPLELHQYSEYLEDEVKYRTAKAYQRDRDFWTQKLADTDEGLSFYGLQPARKTGVISQNVETISKQTLSLLDDWLRQKQGAEASHSARLNFFLATLAIYLSKVSGKRTVSIGMPLHNRRSKRFKATIGSFMHVVPLRITVAPDDTLETLMARIAQLSFEALRYGRAALSNSKQQPLYDCMLNYHLSEFPDFGGSPIRMRWVHPGVGHLALTLQISDFELQGHLDLTFECHHECFPAPVRSAVPRQFIQIFEICLETPQLPVSRIPVLLPAEEEALAAFNPPVEPFPSSETMLACVHRAAALVPSRLAVAANGETLTYASLNAQATRLAYLLLERGVTCETRVGICLNKETDLIVAVLAVIKAGGCFVPLDPGYPQQRLGYMVGDCDARIILTKSQFLPQLPEQGPEILLLDSDLEDAPHQPLPQLYADQAAYVIYTSGSSGLPKGVMISHRAWHNAFRAWETSYKLHFGETVHLQMAGFSFDVFCGDLVRGLCSAGTLVLVDKDTLLQPERLYQLIKQYGVTHAEFVPAVLRHLADFLEKQSLDLSALHLLAAGSDAWFVQEYNRFRKLLAPKARLINSYGVSEATIDSCYFEAEGLLPPSDRSVPVGRPFTNMQLYALDEVQQLCAVGVPGQLYIAGEGLARGYLNKPGMTAEKFVPHPFGKGERAYCSGDKVRHLPGSLDLEFLGRMDFQIKIRGFRVEPGEIEAVLAGLEGIQSCALTVRERGTSGDKMLVAHILPAAPVDDLDAWRAGLRQQAQAHLPDHMVPSVFDCLESMPLSPNGKIDRAQLAKHDVEAGVSEGPLEPPRNKAEEVMLEIWQKVLGKERIGIHSNFFELGGHSLTAVRLIAQLRDRFERPIQLPELFAKPTIAALAEQVTQGTSSFQRLVTLQPKGHLPPFFMVHAVGGSVMSYKSLAQHWNPNRPLVAIQGDSQNPIETIEALAATYIQAIKTHQPHGPYWLGGWSFGGTVAFEMARQLLAAGETLARLILIDSMPFDQMNLGPEFGEADVMASFVNQIAREVDEFRVSADVLRTMPEADRLNYILAQAKLAGVLPSSTELNQLLQQWTYFKTNAMASYYYRPEPISATVHLMRAEELDPLLPDLPHNGWQPYAPHLKTQTVPGNHMSMVAEPHVRVLAAAMNQALEGDA